MIKQSSCIAFLACTLSFSGLSMADNLNKVLDSSAKKSTAAQQSQQKIDQLADQTQENLAQYRQTSKIVEDLQVYNRKLEIQIDKQQQRLKQIEASIEEATVVQRRILPLVEDMIDSLANFIAIDIPFHLDEREQRIAFLRDNLQRPDLSIAEKFRQVLEAYKIESEYGRRIDSYSSTVNIDGQERDVTMLRVGRIALLYQTADLLHTGMWDKQSKGWQALDQGDYRDAVRQGVRMANRQASIDILDIPVAAAEKQ